LGVQRVERRHHLGEPLLIQVRNRLGRIGAHDVKATVSPGRPIAVSRRTVPFLPVPQLNESPERDGSLGRPEDRLGRLTKSFPHTREARSLDCLDHRSSRRAAT
jgi:hypothetical protein